MARPSVTVEIKGLKELKQKMLMLAKDMQIDTANKAVASGAAVVRKAAKANVRAIADKPYIASGGEANRTVGKVQVDPGNVPKNIIMKRVKNPKNATSVYRVALRSKKKYGYASRIGALIEFGTVKQSPQPFLAPALRDNLQSVQAAMVRRLKLRLRRLGAV